MQLFFCSRCGRLIPPEALVDGQPRTVEGKPRCELCLEVLYGPDGSESARLRAETPPSGSVAVAAAEVSAPPLPSVTTSGRLEQVRAERRKSNSGLLVGAGIAGAAIVLIVVVIAMLKGPSVSKGTGQSQTLDIPKSAAPDAAPEKKDLAAAAPAKAADAKDDSKAIERVDSAPALNDKSNIAAAPAAGNDAAKKTTDDGVRVLATVSDPVTAVITPPPGTQPDAGANVIGPPPTAKIDTGANVIGPPPAIKAGGLPGLPKIETPFTPTAAEAGLRAGLGLAAKAPEGREVMAALWMFDEGAGDVAGDASPKRAHGKIQGAVWAKGQTGGALDFNGKDSYVEVAEAKDLDLTEGRFTIAAWISPRTFGDGGGGRIVDHGGGSDGGGGWTLQLYSPRGDQKLMFQVNNNASVYTSDSGIIKLNTWQHVAMTFERGTVTFYEDGEKKGEQRGVPAPRSARAPVRIGMRATDLQKGFDGLIDEVRIYPWALNADQVKDAMKGRAVEPPPKEAEAAAAVAAVEDVKPSAGGPAITQGLIAAWKFKEGKGKTVADSAAAKGAGYAVAWDGKAKLTWAQAAFHKGLTGSCVTIEGAESGFNYNGMVPLGDGAFSLCAWIKAKKSGKKMVIMGQMDYSGASTGWYFCIDDNGKLELRTNGSKNGTGSFHLKETTTSVDDDKWHHAVVIRDPGKSTKFYIDGVLKSDAGRQNNSNVNAPGVGFKLGWDWPWESGNTLNGSLGDVRIYNRALPDADVRAIYWGR
jgi:hypothetical protein